MGSLADSNVVAALIGAAAALLFTAGRDLLSERKRRRSVASALVWEVRVRERKLQGDLRAASEHKVVVFDPPPSETLMTTFLNDLPNLGAAVFGAVRAAYGQYRQIG